MHYIYKLSIILCTIILNFTPCFGQFKNQHIYQMAKIKPYYSTDISHLNYWPIEEHFNDTTPDCLVNKLRILQNANSSFGFNVFPNPNRGEFCVHFEKMCSSLQIELSNTEGELLCLRQNPLKATHFSLPDLSSGTYVITVSDDTRTVSTRIQIER